MSTSRFRGHYQSLTQIAKTFQQQSEAVGQTRQNLQNRLEALRGGDWRGDAANKFYGEMDSAVMPTLQRLQRALDEAARTTNTISKVVKQAEDDSSKVFVLVVSGAGTGPTVEAPQPGGGGSGGSSGGGSGSGSGSGGSGGTSGGGSGSGSGSGSAASGGGGSGSGGAATGTPTSRMLSGLDPQVAAIAQQSPTLQNELQQLEQQGWTIVAGRPGAGAVTNQRTKTITIDPGKSVAQQVSSVAHETGHALYGEPPYHAPTPTMTRDQYVQQNVDEQLKGEGNAIFNATQVRSEILAARGPDIGIAGNQSAAYKQSFSDFQAGRINRDQAIGQMANSVGNDSTGNTHENYRDYYGKTYRDFWDANIAPTRRTP